MRSGLPPGVIDGRVCLAPYFAVSLNEVGTVGSSGELQLPNQPHSQPHFRTLAEVANHQAFCPIYCLCLCFDGGREQKCPAI